MAFESTDGKELYFTKLPTTLTATENSLWKMALPDGPEEQVAGPLAARNFGTSIRGVYYIQQSPDAAIIKFLPYGSRSAQTIAALENGLFWGLTISPDERFALYSQDEVRNAELMLVEGFGRKDAR